MSGHDVAGAWARSEKYSGVQSRILKREGKGGAQPLYDSPQVTPQVTLGSLFGTAFVVYQRSCANQTRTNVFFVPLVWPNWD